LSESSGADRGSTILKRGYRAKLYIGKPPSEPWFNVGSSHSLNTLVVNVRG
jgi:hypothetical protein